MTKRTYNIIMACKQGKHLNCLENVKEFLEKEFGMRLNRFGDIEAADIMKEAMYDYIDTCEKPSTFFREMETIFGSNKFSIGEWIGRTFKIVRVKDRFGIYVNGFGEWAKDE